VSWDHFLLLFTGVLGGVGGTVVLNTMGISKVLQMVFMRCAYPLGPTGEVLWCMQSIWMSRLSIQGSIWSSGGIVGSSYVMVAALKLGGGGS
jgi:hypothetical protein